MTIRLEQLRSALAEQIGCDVKDLRLDHDPPLGARPRRRSGLGRKTYYTPDANDPDHLFYRPHGPEHAGSHLVKTNIRGDHGQHPDRVLIKKERKRERSRNGETRRKASKFPKLASQLKRGAGFGGGKIPRPSRAEESAAKSFFNQVRKLTGGKSVMIISDDALQPAIASGRMEDAQDRVYPRRTKRVGRATILRKTPKRGSKAKHRWPKRPFRRKP